MCWIVVWEGFCGGAEGQGPQPGSPGIEKATAGVNAPPPAVLPETRIRTLAALHANIQDAFNEHGVQVMSPHYVADPAGKVGVPREKWFEPPAKPLESTKNREW